MDQSWYHSLKGLPPILDVYIALVASNAECAGIKCFLKPSLNVAHVPKDTGVWSRAFFCKSWAHSPADVPILKYVKADDIFFPSVLKNISI